MKGGILETARRLFNEYGYNGVSMRDIAGALDISVGNLTYHFPRKEDLIEAVVVEQFSAYRKRPPAQTLGELDAFFRRRLDYQKRNAYYFRHYTQLAQISPRICEQQRQVIHDLFEFLRETFRNFRLSGRMEDELLPGQTQNLMKALVTICTLGMALDEEGRRPCLWSLIYPTLTGRGREEYFLLMQKNGADPV